MNIIEKFKRWNKKRKMNNEIQTVRDRYIDLFLIADPTDPRFELLSELKSIEINKIIEKNKL